MKGIIVEVVRVSMCRFRFKLYQAVVQRCRMICFKFMYWLRLGAVVPVWFCLSSILQYQSQFGTNWLNRCIVPFLRDFSSPPSTLSFRSVASHSLPSSSALLVRPCNRARCCDIQEDALGKDDGCELASLPCCCRCGSSGHNYYTLFSSVWHFGRSAPVVGTFVWMDGLSSVDVLADVFVDVCFVEFRFLFLDVHFYM